MTTLDMRQELIDQIDFAWEYMFMPRMNGLTDEEYLWEPVADVWTVHPGTGGEAPTVDPQLNADPAPFTTIAWRMWHMTGFFTNRWVSHFGNEETDSRDVPGAITAQDGLNALTSAYQRWLDALRSMPVEKLGEACGQAEHHYPEKPFATLVLHINREFIHHAAECNLIRDLYRQRESLQG